MRTLLIGILALLVLAGCSTPAYVGVYQAVPSPAQQKAYDDLKASIPKMREDQRAAATKQLDAMKRMNSMGMELRVNGTWATRDPMTGNEVGGTYTASGNSISLSAPEPMNEGTPKRVFTFDEKAGTLTITGPDGQTFMFKKSSK